MGSCPRAAYIDALLRDLALQSELIRGRDLRSIFLGGGTPSLFAPDALARLFEGIRSQCELAADVEITLEANPGTIERGRFSDYRAIGVTRVSLGAQSFDDAQLLTIGRIHAAADTHRAVEELHAAGLTNFNLDLMYGLPHQSTQGAVADIETALSLRPAHISHYQLTLEAGTVFAGRPPPGLPDVDLAGDMQIACQQRLAGEGFAQYEVSAYAPALQRCRHNLNYWEFGDYLGIGAGAHGKFSSLQEPALIVERSTRAREPRRYLSSIGAVPALLERRRIPARDLPFEFLLNALRLNEGFASETFEARTGLSIESIARPLERARSRGLIRRRDEGWQASEKGFNFLNDLQEIFLPELSDNDSPQRRMSPTP